MINFSKKKMGALAIGTLMTFGAAFPALTEAASYNSNCGGSGDGGRPPMMEGWGGHQGGPGQHWLSPEMEKELNISKSDLDSYKEKGYRRGDVVQAAFIAKASGKSLDKVLSYKTDDTTWQYVMKKAGVTEDQLRQVHEDLFADTVSQQTGTDKGTVQALQQQGYHGRDIMMAAQLAKASSKPINDVLGMKKINNSWKDVADSLGVNWDSFRQDMMAGHHGWGGNDKK
ncbi:hypothetical protein [Pectinatus haikarae]|uniref:hypothetical protein n=1 Tax=Pectinatus haikarae TaxID=349096 RepID=UPI0018C49DD6|nr:hypothetical protein [Pectinatus haikarae]